MKPAVLLLAWMLTACPASAQFRMGKEVAVGKPYMRCNEPALALNPNKPSQQLIATNIRHLFRSKKGGKHWKHAEAKSSHGVYGDPVLLFDENGIAYFVHLSKDSSRQWPDFFDGIVVQRSTDAGKTWNDGVCVGRNGRMHDKAWISIDEQSGSRHRGNLYLSWTQFDRYESRDPKDSTRILVSRSTDHGLSFSEPVIISDRSGDCLDSDHTVEGATTCTGPDGTVYAVWAGDEKLYLDESHDGGLHWGTDRIIGEIPGGWDLSVAGFMRTNGLPFIVADSTGKLLVCAVREEQGFARLVFFESHDRGKTWTSSTPRSEAKDAHCFMPHAFHDRRTGLTAVLYYRYLNGLTDVVLSVRPAGQNSWTTLQMNRRSFPAPGKGVFFGDYINVCSAGNEIAAVWIETHGKQTIVKTRRLTYTGMK